MTLAGPARQNTPTALLAIPTHKTSNKCNTRLSSPLQGQQLTARRRFSTLLPVIQYRAELRLYLPLHGAQLTQDVGKPSAFAHIPGLRLSAGGGYDATGSTRKVKTASIRGHRRKLVEHCPEEADSSLQSSAVAMLKEIKALLQIDMRAPSRIFELIHVAAIELIRKDLEPVRILQPVNPEIICLVATDVPPITRALVEGADAGLKGLLQGILGGEWLAPPVEELNVEPGVLIGSVNTSSAFAPR